MIGVGEQGGTGSLVKPDLRQQLTSVLTLPIAAGGPGSFIVPAEDIWSFRDAIARKMLREVEQSIS